MSCWIVSNFQLQRFPMFNFKLLRKQVKVTQLIDKQIFLIEGNRGKMDSYGVSVLDRAERLTFDEGAT